MPGQLFSRRPGSDYSFRDVVTNRRVRASLNLYAALLAAGEAVSQNIGSGRIGWMQVARGSVQLDGRTLQRWDATVLS